LRQSQGAGRCQFGQSGIGRTDDLTVGNAPRQALEGGWHQVGCNRLCMSRGGVIQVRQMAAARSFVGIALYQGHERSAVRLGSSLCEQIEG